MSQVAKYQIDNSILTSVRTWSLGTSSKGNDYVRVSFENYISWTGYLTDLTIERTMQTLALLGFKGSDLSQLSKDDALSLDDDFAAVIGEIREYEGKTYYTAKFINQGTSQGFDKRSKDMVDKFAKYETSKYIESTNDVKEAADAWNDPSARIYENNNFNQDEIPF